MCQSVWDSREKFNIDILAHTFFEVNTHMEKPGKKFGIKKFSRLSHTDWHKLFRILWFFELGFFGAEGGLCPKHELKVRQFWDYQNNLKPPKFCWNFSKKIRFLVYQFWKEFCFLGLLQTPNLPRVCGKLPKVIIIEQNFAFEAIPDFFRCHCMRYLDFLNIYRHKGF